MSDGHCNGACGSTCREEFEEIHRKLDRLDEAIRGNGRPGITLRLDRLEQSARRHARLIWLLAGAGITGGMTVVTTWIVA